MTFISSLNNFSRRWPEGCHDLDRVVQRYPFRVSRYFAGLVQSPGDAIWRQVVPDIMEMEDVTGWKDPLAEENLSPVPNLVHRYPNRVLWLVSRECAVHCRFCTRKRRWKKPLPLTQEYFQGALDYIASHGDVRDVVLSGGDPLLLPLPRLESILMSLRKIPHVTVIRIGTRVPCALPDKITPELVGMLARYHPLFINLHFNHPLEITPESSRACALLADAGLPLGSQTVLLRGINDRTRRPCRAVSGTPGLKGASVLPHADGPHRGHCSFPNPGEQRPEYSQEHPQPDFGIGNAPFCHRSSGRAWKSPVASRFCEGHRERYAGTAGLSGKRLSLPAPSGGGGGTGPAAEAVTSSGE